MLLHLLGLYLALCYGWALWLLLRLVRLERALGRRAGARSFTAGHRRHRPARDAPARLPAHESVLQ